MKETYKKSSPGICPIYLRNKVALCVSDEMEWPHFLDDRKLSPDSGLEWTAFFFTLFFSDVILEQRYNVKTTNMPGICIQRENIQDEKSFVWFFDICICVSLEIHGFLADLAGKPPNKNTEISQHTYIKMRTFIISVTPRCIDDTCWTGLGIRLARLYTFRWF